jgi:haloalkane dehalogenase
MDVIRTPDARFEDLPDYPFEPHYALLPTADNGRDAEVRVHYLDEGPADAAPVLLMHGEPSWSYLYRHMIPPLVAAGNRVIAPDLVGFGRSDKPMQQQDYTYARHVAWMSSLLFDILDLQDITFFGQDWGGLVGLRLVAAQPDRYARVVIGNTGLPTGHGPPSDAFLAWQKYSQETPDFPVGTIISGGVAQGMTPEVVAAYDAPFPDDRFKAGARIFPTLVPTSPDDPASADNVTAWEVLSRFEKPFVLAFSDSDPITKGGDAPFRSKVLGAEGQPHTTIEGGGHFLQEDRPQELVQVILDCIARG